jgi:hypothetical protein
VVFFSHSLKADFSKNSLHFVEIILLKSYDFNLALRKRLFFIVKPTLLPCKTAAFGTQNNRFCNALKIKGLRDSYAYEKYLQLFLSFPTIKQGIKEKRK